MSTKVCKICTKEKKIDAFYKDKKMKDGHRNDCKDCLKAYMNGKQTKTHPKQPRPRKIARVLEPSEKRSRYLKYAYGITNEQYDAMYEEQEGQCKICSRVETMLFVDHCHDSNKVRALLCHRCNVGIGMFLENSDSLRKAAEYLESFSNILPPS